MTDPSFTHQRLLGVALPFWPVHPDVALIDSLLARERLDNVSAILIGHSHYDHLLDAPFLTETKAKAAIIYGSPTMANILAPIGELRGRVHAVPEDSLGTAKAPGRWYAMAGGHARFMALEVDYAAGNLGFIHWRSLPTRLTYNPRTRSRERRMDGTRAKCTVV